MFGAKWIDGQAKIVDSHVKSTSGDGLVTVREYAADVTVPGRAPFRTILQEPRIATNFWGPSIGDVVAVHVDPKHDKARFDKDDPKVDAKARERAINDEFARTAAQPPGT